MKDRKNTELFSCDTKREKADRFKQETLAAWEEYRNTGESLSHDDVVTWLVTWGTDHEMNAPQ